MKTLFKIFGATLLGLLLLILIPTVWGMFLNESHQKSVSRTYPVAQEDLWDMLAEPEARISWYNYLTDVVRLEAGEEGYPRWKEFYVDGQSMEFERLESRRYHQVIRIAQENLPFGGTWTIDLTPATDGGTTLTITEDGEIYNPFFRFVFRYVIGYDTTIRQYMEDLAQEVALQTTDT